MDNDSSIDNLVGNKLPESITPEKGVLKKLIGDYGDLVLAMGCGTVVGHPYVLIENLSDLGAAIWLYSAMVAPLVALFGSENETKGLRNSFAYLAALAYSISPYLCPDYQAVATAIPLSLTGIIEHVRLSENRLKENKEEVKV
jgi:hypothetical protein